MIQIAALVFCLALASAVGGPSLQARPQSQASQTPPPSAAAGKEILQRKCFQCHQLSLWASVRGDRREWLGVLYRMVGRGALWTEDEINAMADFLAQTRGKS